jgi:hypothetical protein
LPTGGCLSRQVTSTLLPNLRRLVASVIRERRTLGLGLDPSTASADNRADLLSVLARDESLTDEDIQFVLHGMEGANPRSACTRPSHATSVPVVGGADLMPHCSPLTELTSRLRVLCYVMFERRPAASTL